MRVFNTLSNGIEPFLPVEPGRIVLYVCGLTPYDSAHIGHARTYVSFDVIKRHLLKKGFAVYHIQNITDVEDKILKRCGEIHADPKQLTEKIHSEAMQQFAALNILPADVYPKVTDNIPEIISMVQAIIDAGKAYETKTGIYFDISSFRDYGKLSSQNLDQIRAGSRFEVDESKKNPADFALWKKTSGELLEFESPWGKGRPGWHIECSAISMKYAKRTLDIHGGARDLVFPHHENEIAQAEAATKEKYCKYWMHTGFLTVKGEKMSKSLGNFVTLKNALENSSSNALRLFFLQAHYRSPLDYDLEKINSMEESVERIFNSFDLISESLSKKDVPNQEFREKSNYHIESFYKNMDDDFRTPEALADLFNLLRLANSHIIQDAVDVQQLRAVKSAIGDILWIFGLEKQKKSIDSRKQQILKLIRDLGEPVPESAEEAVKLLIGLRQSARESKNYQKADLIRSRLSEIGIILEDKPDGVRWKIQ
ncbi:cysteine--tRNA ligase [Candidatus Micrarchaeota archaeon]|nr:cysteine--tRNA ligase [Candidatus Micrarchaeota archaeon]